MTRRAYPLRQRIAYNAGMRAGTTRFARLLGMLHVWKKKGILRAASWNFEGQGHFGVDWNVFKVKTLSNSSKRVYVYLCRVSDAEGYCFPFLRTIASRTDLSTSTVGNALKELKRARLIRIEYRYSRRGGSSSHYHLRKVAQVYPGIVNERPTAFTDRPRLIH
jgi:DNA-binding transcriptional ArsR family regulator